MATDSGSKPGASRGGRRSNPTARTASVLDKLGPSELATVLRALLTGHPDLLAEAESLAVELVSSPSVETIAEDVLDALTALDMDSLDGRAGNQSWGYVEPTEAAWELLGEAVEDVISDMQRRMDLGLHEAAQAICCGLVLGLNTASRVESDGPLQWAPDFPAEEACEAVAGLIGACAAKDRRAFHNQLVEFVNERVPEWAEMIARAANHALNHR